MIWSAIISVLWVLFESYYAFWQIIRRRGKFWEAIDKAEYLTIVMYFTFISLAVRFSHAEVTKYHIIAGSGLILIGWLGKYQLPLISFYERHPKCERVFYFITAFSSYPGWHKYRLGYLSDWLQLLGFSLLWAASPGIVILGILLPFGINHLMYSILPRGTTLPRDSAEKMEEVGMIASIMFRSLMAVSLPAFLLAVSLREVQIFLGSAADATELLSTLVQIEAAIGALVAALLFLMVELTSSGYSPRLSYHLSSRQPFKVMVYTALISVGLKILFLANSRWLGLAGGAIQSSAKVDLIILLTMGSGLSFAYFIRDAFRFHLPERLVEEALRDLDEDWMERVRDEWSNRFGPRRIYITRDPMIPVTAYLLAAINRADINSIRSALILIRRRCKEVCHDEDGGILDLYLTYHLSTPIQQAARKHFEEALIDIGEILEPVVSSAWESIRDVEVYSFDVIPLGTRLIRKLLDASFSNALSDASKHMEIVLSRASIAALKALPDYSDLLEINEEYQAMALSEDERDRLHNNDKILDSFVRGYIRYFGILGVRSIRQDMEPLAFSFSYNLSRLIDAILTEIEDERFQKYLINRSLASLKDIIREASEGSIPGLIAYPSIGFHAHRITDLEIANVITNYFSYYIKLMARGGILDNIALYQLTNPILSLSLNNPEIVVKPIEALGEAAAKIISDIEQYESALYEQLMVELKNDIDLLERRGLTSDNAEEVRQVAFTARNRIESNGN